MSILQNFYREEVSQKILAGALKLYVSAAPVPTEGWLTINPGSPTGREIVKYISVGNDASGDFVMLEERGVGGTSDQDHDIQEPVRMNITAEHWAVLVAIVNSALTSADKDNATDLGGETSTNDKIPSQLAVKTYADAIVEALNVLVVKLAGDQDITGLKTFTVSPLIPDAALAQNPASFKQLQDAILNGASYASETVAGLVEIATAAQIAAGTDVGESGAPLVVVPSMIPSYVYNPTTNYALNETVFYNRGVWVSNFDSNTGNTPGDDISISDGKAGFMVFASLANCSDFQFSADGTKIYVLGQSSAIHEYNLSTAWDPETAVYNSVSLAVNSQDTSSNGFYISPDGLKLFMVGLSTDRVYAYTMSTAWALSTATYDSVSYRISGQETNPYSVNFSDDGLKMFVLGSTGDDVNEYTLSVAWDLSSTVTFIDSYSVATQEPNPYGMRFYNGGLNFTLTGANRYVYRYELSTAFDVSTASYMGDPLPLQSITAEATYQAQFSPDGLKIFTLEFSTEKMVAITLESAYNFSGVSYSGNSYLVSGQESNPYKTKFNTDGTKMYVIGTTGDTIYQYNVNVAWDITSISYTGANLSIAAQETNPYGLCFSADGTKAYVLGNLDTIFQYTLSTAWDITSGFYASKSFVTTTQETNPRGVTFTPDGLIMLVVGNNGYIYEYDLGTAWDVTTAVYSTVSKVLKNGAAMDIEYLDSGNKLMIMTDGTDTIDLYSMSTAYDISTLEYLASALVNDNATTLTGLHVKPDGLKVFINGNNQDRVYEYDLPAANTIYSTTNTIKSVIVSSQENSPTAVWMKPDGTLMWVVGTTGDRLYEYELSTPFDVSTAVYNSRQYYSGGVVSNPYAIQFSPDGTKFYVSTSSIVYEYDMSVAWDITTAVYNSVNKNWTSVGTDMSGAIYQFMFNDEGTEAYVVCQSTATSRYGIYKFTLSTAYNFSTLAFVGHVYDSHALGSQYGGVIGKYGTKMYLNDSSKVTELTLKTPYDVSSAQVTGRTLPLTLFSGTNYSIQLSPDEKSLYLAVNGDDAVHQVSYVEALFGKWTKISV